VNPLRVLDCKVETDQAILAAAPVLLDFLCPPCAEHLAAVRRLLEDAGIPFAVDPRMVRGLDYYQRTVFEVVSDRLGAQSSLLGGGRYDGLVADLGGPSIPGFGFAIGLERLLLLLPPGPAPGPGLDALLVTLGEAGWAAATGLARRLRGAGLRVVLPLAPRPLGAQMRRAERSGARFAVFVGGDELAAGMFGLKDLASGAQIQVDEAGLLARLGDTHAR
jgi:histidyl-tRNA synthetase